MPGALHPSTEKQTTNKDLVFSFLTLEKFVILCKNENQDRPEHTPDLSPCSGTPSLDWCIPQFTGGPAAGPTGI